MAFTSQAKHFGFTVSIDKGTNKVITCSQGNWDLLKENRSSISFGDDGVMYKVANKEKAKIKKSVEIFDGDKLRINGNVNFELCPSDSISFSHKQYNLNKITEVKSAGGQYSKGDKLIPSNATAKYNTFDGTDSYAEFTVEEVDESGAIKSIKNTREGVYNSFLSDNVEFSGGTGGGFTAKCLFDLAPEVFSEERVVLDISVENSNNSVYSILYLDQPLPQKVLSGKIKTEKWYVYLNTNYEGQSKTNVPYTIAKDFTPGASLPLIMGDVHNSKTLYNESMFIIDSKIKNLQSQIDEMSDKVSKCLADFEVFQANTFSIATSNRVELEDLKTKYEQIGDIHIETSEKSRASFLTIGTQIDELIKQVNELKEAAPPSEE
jgi:hypothetical protein